MTDQENIKLNDLISESNIQEAINTLLSIELNESRKKEVLAISSRYNNLTAKKTQGILSFEILERTENQITIDLIEVVNRSEKSKSFSKESIVEEHQLKNTFGKLLPLLVAIIVVIILVVKVSELPNIISWNENKKLQLTVFVTDKDGNVVLENEGRLNIPLGNRSLNEIIGSKGRTNFPDITTDNKGDTILIGLEAENWEIIDGKNEFIFNGEPIRLMVKKDNRLSIIKGTVKSRDGQEFVEGALIRINSDTSVVSNTLGIFKIELPEEMSVSKKTDSYLLTISKSGFKVKTQYHYPLSSDAEIRLEIE